MADNPELIELIRKSQEGDRDAKNEICKKYERMVWKIVNKFSHLKNSEDAFQTGMIGLLKAIEKFDESLNLKFITFAFVTVKGQILRGIRDNDFVSTVPKVSRQDKEIANKISRKIQSGKEFEEAVRELGISNAYEVRKYWDILNPLKSFDEVFYQESDNKEMTVHQAVGKKDDEYDLKTLILDVTKILNPREIKVFNMRFFQGFTQQEVADELGVSQVQSSRIEKKIRQKIEEYLGYIPNEKERKNYSSVDIIHLLNTTSLRQSEIARMVGAPPMAVNRIAAELKRENLLNVGG